MLDHDTAAVIGSMKAAARPTAEIVREVRRRRPDVHRQTAYRWVRTVPEASSPGPLPPRPEPPPAPPSWPDPERPAPPKPADASAEGVAQALETDDLAELVRTRDAIAVAAREWERSLGHNASAVLQHQRLSKALTDITARIIELRPAPEVDEERFAALGAEARDALIARARAAATADDVTALRVQVRAQAEAIERLASA